MKLRLFNVSCVEIKFSINEKCIYYNHFTTSLLIKYSQLTYTTKFMRNIPYKEKEVIIIEYFIKLISPKSIKGFRTNKIRKSY